MAKRSLGFWRSWALVVGVMIGNGIFMLPAILAPYGSMSLLGWIFAGGGTLFIAFVFSSLAKKIPRTGGPYAYTQEAFGNLPGFLIGWGHWIAIWSATSAGAVAFTGYLSVFIPELEQIPVFGAISSITLIWLLTGINISGVRSAGIFQLITTLLKLLPLFVIAGCGLFLGDFNVIPTENPEQEPVPILIAELIILIMWAYVGVEGITIPTDDVIEPSKTIPKALITGTITVTIVYMIATYGVMTLVPVEQLGSSSSPFADAATIIFGPWGVSLITIGAIISIIGALNGNILFTGILSQSIAKDRLFPKKFTDINRFGAPAFGLIVAGLLSSVFIVMNYSKGLVSAFKALILLSTLTTLLPYAVSALADIVIQRREERNSKKRNWKSYIFSFGALGFSLFTIVGAGLNTLVLGLILLIIGLVLYYLILYRKYLLKLE
jgi:APA family basic amino acid/polyamine antiporter